MSKSLAISLTHLYRDCVMKTRLHNIQCLSDGTPSISKEMSSYSKCVIAVTPTAIHRRKLLSVEDMGGIQVSMNLSNTETLIL